MPEEKGPTAEVVQGLSSIFQRVGEFFHLFDLSFLVSGASTIGAAAFLYLRSSYPRSFPFTPWVGVAALLVGCYICGLLAFATGRSINGKLFRRTLLEDKLPGIVEIHGLTSVTLTSYLSDNPPLRSKVWRLYVRMWSEIAQRNAGSVIFQHLSRYWVMSATYDGIAFSLIVWGATLLLATCPYIVSEPLSVGAGIAGAGIASLFAYVAFRRAADYYLYQIEDVVAAIAARNSVV